MPDRCPTCGTPVDHIHDEPRAGIPITINHRPTTWHGALTAITTGRKAVAANRTRGDRGGTTTTHWRITHWRIAAGPQPGDTWHTEHTCGTTDPAPPPNTNTRPADDGPRY